MDRFANLAPDCLSFASMLNKKFFSLPTASWILLGIMLAIGFLAWKGRQLKVDGSVAAVIIGFGITWILGFGALFVMSKRSRLFIVILVVVMCGAFLYPTIKWYGFVPQATKDLATGSNVQIKEYARGQATRDLRALKDLVAKDGNAAVPSEYKYLQTTAKANYKASKESVPSSWWISLKKRWKRKTKAVKHGR